MVLSPENSRTTTNWTFLFCFLFFSIGYLHRMGDQTVAAATKSGNGHQKTCKLSSDPDFLLFKFSYKISLLSLPEVSRSQPFCLPYPANIRGLEKGFQPVTTVFMISLILWSCHRFGSSKVCPSASLNNCLEQTMFPV